VGAAIHFSVGIVLARLLEPGYFGVFFAVTAYTALLMRQVQFGIPEALLQAKELHDNDWNTGFWFMLALAMVLAGLIYAASGWLGEFYGDPRYETVMQWMLIPLLVSPYAVTNATILRRAMNYKTLAKISVIVAMMSIPVSIGAALTGFGVYTFVISGIFGAFLTAILMGRACHWRPSGPGRVTAIGKLWRYGWRMHVNNTLNLAAAKVDNMIIGRMVGIQELGIYMRAYSLSRLPVTELLGRLYQVLFSGFSRVQEDIARSITIHEKILCAVTSAIFPLLLILIFIAEGFIGILYGEKWLPAVLPLQIMALGSFAITITMTLGALSDAQGLVGREIPIQAINLVLTIAAVLIGARWGLEGVAVGIALKGFIVLGLMQRMLQRSHLSLTWSPLGRAIAPAVICCVIGGSAAMAASWLSADTLSRGGFPHTLAVGTAAALTYAGSWLLLGHYMRNHQSLQACVNMLREMSGHFRRTKTASSGGV
jgi:O-antigen/teichoic acid export membrane protein